MAASCCSINGELLEPLNGSFSALDPGRLIWLLKRHSLADPLTRLP